MTWNSDLVPAALANAQNNANNNVFVHTSNDQYGENIAYQYGYNNPLYLGYLWYDEVTQYNFYNPGFSDATGHFTQLVWLDSTELGCAYVQASNSLSNNGYYYLSVSPYQSVDQKRTGINACSVSIIHLETIMASMRRRCWRQTTTRSRRSQLNTSKFDILWFVGRSVSLDSVFICTCIYNNYINVEIRVCFDSRSSASIFC